jgi:hypothetical protein
MPATLDLTPKAPGQWPLYWIDELARIATACGCDFEDWGLIDQATELFDAGETPYSAAATIWPGCG